MKKFIIQTLLLTLTLVVSSCCFSSCSDDDNDTKKNPLVGTKWYSSNYATIIYGGLNGGGTWNLVYEFKSNTVFNAYFLCLTTGEKGRDYGDGKYKYLDDHIIFIEDDGTDGGTFWFRSDTWLCSQKEGTSGTMISLYKNKPQY